MRHVVLCVAYCYVLSRPKWNFLFSPSRVVSLLFFFGCSQIRVRLPPARLYSNFWRHSTRLVEKIDFHLSIDRFFFSPIFSLIQIETFKKMTKFHSSLSLYVCVCVSSDGLIAMLTFPILSLSSMRSVVMATSYNPLPLPPQHARYTQCLVE